jgi:hypothetical protein
MTCCAEPRTETLPGDGNESSLRLVTREPEEEERKWAALCLAVSEPFVPPTARDIAAALNEALKKIHDPVVEYVFELFECTPSRIDAILAATAARGPGDSDG